MNAAASVPVWSAAVRAAHWALAACVIACLWLYHGGPWHEGLGHAALVLAAWRWLMGLTSRSPHVRFSAFVRGPAATRAHVLALLARNEPRHLGHNPLGGWMIIALLAAAIIAGASGALYATDRFWGDASIYAVHQATGWSFVVLVPLHLGGVLLTSILQRENLIRSMITGRKRAPAASDIDIT